MLCVIVSVIGAEQETTNEFRASCRSPSDQSPSVGPSRLACEKVPRGRGRPRERARGPRSTKMHSERRTV